MGRTLALHGELREPASRPRHAIVAKGFRPFFVLAAAYAVLIVPLWLAILHGIASARTYLDPLTWHGHEMVFGFTVAVMAGFLLTAVGNWTQRETLVGSPLLGLAGLWILGRLAMMFPSALPRGLPAILDAAFLPVLAAVIARPLIATKNRRNLVMVAVLCALSITNVVVHLDALGLVEAGAARRATTVSVDVVVLVVLLIAGRVFPMFTRNATSVSTIRSLPVLDVATAAGMVVVVAADAIASDPTIPSLLAGVVGLLAAARAVHWGAQHSVREPLLWILHAGYAWLVLGLLMRGLTAWMPSLPSSLATHAITVGGIGSLTLGMMARVSLGHTGRALATPAAMRWAFGAIVAATFVRVVVPLVAPASYFASLVVSGALWALAFATFFVVYLPMLVRPRVDGKAG